MAEFKVEKKFAVVKGYGTEVKVFSYEEDALRFANALNDAFESGKEDGKIEGRKQAEQAVKSVV
jgi:hypothetical protein